MSHLSGEFVKVSSPSPHVLLVELARSPFNAFIENYRIDYGQLFDKISKDPDVRAVVLASGLKKLFTAGIDFGFLKDLESKGQDPAREAVRLQQTIADFQRDVAAPERCRCPVIAAVHGVAYGLAIDILSACDIRYAATDSEFSIKEVDVGLAADMGTLARISKISANESLVRELAFTSRNFDAAEAQKLGFVSRVVEGSRDEVLAAALDLAKLIATKSPISVIGTKELLLHARDHSVAHNLRYTAAWNSVMLQTDDISKAVKAFQTKTKPTYESLPKL